LKVLKCRIQPNQQHFFNEIKMELVTITCHAEALLLQKHYHSNQSIEWCLQCSNSDSQRRPHRRIRRRRRHRCFSSIPIIWILPLSYALYTINVHVSGFIPCLTAPHVSSRILVKVRRPLLQQRQPRDQVEDTMEYVYDGDGALTNETFRERYGDTLPTWLLDKCDECGWTYPTRIQEKVLDTVLSETGSGKTLSFLLPCLASIDASRAAVQVLIVVPTRELGLQISRVAKRLAVASDTNKIMVMSVLQGSQNRRQRAWAWAEPPHMIIGTPDELCSMIQNGGIRRYNSIKYLVVDEVDACLLNNIGKVSSGPLQFAGTTLHELLSKHLSPTYDDGKEAMAMESDSAAANVGPIGSRPILRSRRTIFCSATIPQHRHFAKQCLQNQWMLQTPTYISLRAGSQHLPSQLKHGYIVTADAGKKLATLRRMLKKLMSTCSETNEPKRVLVFSDNHRPLEDMARHQALISALRYEDSLSQRAVAMDALRGTSKRDYDNVVSIADENSSTVLLRVLLSTDLAARGLDIVDITHIIQMDLPEGADTYVHRAGRTGRFGRPGQVVSIITPEQEFVLQRLTNKLQVDITCIGRQTTADDSKSRQVTEEN
jgi:superfamily II DNA/RNA helicase